MSITFRADAEVINGTAGTSVTVSKPAGTADGDLLIAFISETGVGSITAPAGWTLIGSVASGSSVTQAAYYKIAASEGASWTWTLGASVRNWGWVGAYIGANTTDPIIDAVSNNAFINASNVTPVSGRYSAIPLWWGVFGASAVRTASGAATTWSTNAAYSERFDNSTNGGAGTDICGVVADFEFANEEHRDTLGTSTASLAQTACTSWFLILRPAITAYDGGLIEPIAEIEINGNWEDVSAYVHNTQPATITVGRGNAASVVPPTRITLTLLNDDGRFTDDNPTGAYYPHFKPGCRLRVSVPYGYAPPTELATAYIDSIEPGWDLSTRFATVAITASGKLSRLQRGEDPLLPALQRAIAGSGTLGVPPAAYWTFQDGSNADRVASAVGGPAMLVTGVSFGADSTLAGSGTLAKLTTGASLSGVVRAYEDVGHFVFGLFLKIPSSPTADTTLFEVIAYTGSAYRWKVEIVPGSPDSLRVTAYNVIHTSLGNVSASTVEDEIYGQWVLFTLSVVTNGADVDYSVGYHNGTDGGSAGGTLSSHTHGIVTDWNLYATAGLNDAGIGHAFLIANADFDPDFGTLDFAPAMDGFDGDLPRTRVVRLAAEEGEPLTAVTASNEGGALTMGPQPASSFVAAAREAEDVGRGLLHDAGPGGDLVWLMRGLKYNAPVTMTLDMGEGELAPPFRPVRDVQAIRNDWTISRQGGSSERVQNAESIATHGRFRDSRTINIHDDTRLAQAAGWRVAEGTATDKRYPAICGDLRRSPQLVEEWLNCRIWSRVKATNLMSQHPSVIDADVFIEGYTTVISSDVWKFALNSSPASTWMIGITNDATRAKTQTSTTTLNAAIDDNDTTFNADITDGPLWTTSPSNLQIVVGGEVMDVSAIGPAVLDAFGRTEANGWGNADSGQAWTVSGVAASNFSVGGGLGVHSIPSVGSTLVSALPVSIADLDLYFDVVSSVTPTGAGFELMVQCRYVDANNNLDVRLFPGTGGAVTIAIRETAGGVETTDGFPTVTGATPTTTTRVRLQADGSDLRARAWPASGTQPTTWDVELAGLTHLTAGSIRLSSIIPGGVSNATPFEIRWDNLDVPAMQLFTVTRSANDVVKSHSAGDQVKVYKPARTGL